MSTSGTASPLRVQADLAARLFKSLGDPTRLQILQLLSRGEKHVNELVRLTGSSQGRVSTHLALLRWSGLVSTRREGRAIYYRLKDQRTGLLLRLGNQIAATDTNDKGVTEHLGRFFTSHVIAEPCIDAMDRACVDACPVDCIHFEEGADRMLYINPDECIDCAACRTACPLDAIYPETALPVELQDFGAINRDWYVDQQLARERVDRLKRA